MKKRRLRNAFLFLMALLLSAAFFPKTTAKADDTAYGEAAYSYLQTIFENYGFRVNNNEIQADQSQKQKCGQWIHSVMTSLGYTGYTLESTNYERNKGNFIQDFCYVKRGASPKKIVIGAHYDSVDSYGVEDNGTGVSVLLELAKRFRDVDTPLTLEFCFFDGEEFLGFGGSFEYAGRVLLSEKENTLLYINLDSIGSGDNLYVYGGDYENDVLVRDWGYNMAKSIAGDLGIELRTIPDNITRFRAPTRTEASDQFFFAANKVPYIYFEANAWVDENGNEVYPQRPYNYNTNDPRVGATDVSIKGQIIHSVYDNLETLETLFPGRIRRHMAEVSRIITVMLKNLTVSSPEIYGSEKPADPPEPTEESTEESITEEPTKETEVSSAEATEGSSAGDSEESETDSEEESKKPSENATEESGSEEESETAESGTQSESGMPIDPADHDGGSAKKLSASEIAAITLLPVLAAVWIAGFALYRRGKKGRRK